MRARLGAAWPGEVYLTRPVPLHGDPLMSEFVLTQVLFALSGHDGLRRRATRPVLEKATPVQVQRRKVGYMGFGRMAAPAAALVAQVGFDVTAWADGRGEMEH